MIQSIIEFSASLFQCLVGVDFVLKFNRGTWKKKPLSLLFLILIFAAVLVGDRIDPGFGVMISVVIAALYLVFALTVCEKRYMRAVLSVCIEQSSLILIGSLLYTVFSSAIKDFDVLMQGSDALARNVYLVIGNLLFFVLLRFILTLSDFRDAEGLLTGISAFILSAFTLLGMGITLSLSAFSDDETMRPRILILSVIFTLINLILYIMIARLQKLQKTRMEYKLLQEKTAFEESRQKDAQAIWEHIREQRHDLKQHLTVISGLLSENKTEECQNYVTSLVPEIDRFGTVYSCGNKTLDYLINSKLGTLKDVQIVISGSVGDLSDIPDTELACLLGNILDNAVEAVSAAERKKIELLFIRQNENRVILCKNTVSAPVLEKNKDLRTTKSDKGSHGYGHIIVKSIAEKHNGFAEYFEEDGMFGVQLVLPVPDRE